MKKVTHNNHYDESMSTDVVTGAFMGVTLALFLVLFFGVLTLWANWLKNSGLNYKRPSVGNDGRFFVRKSGSQDLCLQNFLKANLVSVLNNR